jgi:hypothetical protein
VKTYRGKTGGKLSQSQQRIVDRLQAGARIAHSQSGYDLEVSGGAGGFLYDRTVAPATFDSLRHLLVDAGHAPSRWRQAERVQVYLLRVDAQAPAGQAVTP